MSDTLVKHMVDRFLGWKLPKDFSPDHYISFDKQKANDLFERTDGTAWPIGTNLLDAEQAKGLIEYLIAGFTPSDIQTEEEGEAYMTGYFDCNAEADQLRTRNADLELQLSEAQQREGGGEPDGYIEHELFMSDVPTFGFAASHKQLVLDHVRDHVQMLTDEGLDVPVISVKPFWFTTPTANAAVAAVLKKAEEICEKLAIQKLNLEESALDEDDDDEMSEIYAAQASVCSTIKRSIRAIPADTTALREMVTQAVTDYACQVAEKNNGNILLLDGDQAMAIVDSVIKGEK